MPKGSKVEVEIGVGVMNVVRGHDSGINGVCQNPDRTSSSSTLAPDIIASVWSTAGKMWRSLYTAAFSGVRSMQILSLEGTTTTPEHQAAGSVTLDMTPIFSMMIIITILVMENKTESKIIQ